MDLSDRKIDFINILLYFSNHRFDILAILERIQNFEFKLIDLNSIFCNFGNFLN